MNGSGLGSVDLSGSSQLQRPLGSFHRLGDGQPVLGELGHSRCGIRRRRASEANVVAEFPSLGAHGIHLPRSRLGHRRHRIQLALVLSADGHNIAGDTTKAEGDADTGAEFPSNAQSATQTRFQGAVEPFSVRLN